MKLTALLLSMAALFGVNLPLSSALAQTAPSIAGCPIFPTDSVWNTPIDNLPVDPNSSAYIATIGATKGVHPDFGSEWQGAPIGIPYNVVPGTQSKVPMNFDYADESDPGPYPIPLNPFIEGGADSDGDRHILVLDKDHCILYETFYSWPQSDGSWYAGSGAVFDLRSHALRPSGWTSSDAAGLPILPGLVRYDEVAAGEIRHALRFTVPQTRKAYIWPARHYASSLTGTNYPPMGQRFRLKAVFDVSGFSPQVQVILKALKKYGMILADNGSSWFISGVPDQRWDNDMLVGELSLVKGSDFEAIDESSLMINPDSGQAAQANSDHEPPTVPAGLTATPVSSTQINLSWTASTDNVGVTGYRIYRDGSQIATTANTSYQDTGRSPSTTYTYRVAAYDAAGNVSAQSSQASATTAAPSDTQPPTAPTGLTAAVISSTQIDLSWAPSTDNLGVAGYIIYRNGTQVGTTAGTSYQSTGLTASTGYTYQVAAYDRAGNTSAKSVAVTRTTLPASSTKFSIGNHVQTTQKTNVRSLPSSSGTTIGTQRKGAMGTVVGGPAYWNQGWWWQIDFNNGTDGWVAEGKLKKVLP